MQRPGRVVLPIALLAVACGGDGVTLPGSGDPATLSIVSGDGQQATAGEAVPQPLVVELADAGGRPVAGATVIFRFAGDFPDASLDQSTPATDTSGRASANARLGTVAGDQPIEAQVATPGRDLQVRFRLTAVAPTPVGGGDQGGQGGGGRGGGGQGGSGQGGGGTPDGGGGGSGGGGGGGNQGDSNGGHGHGHDHGPQHGHGHGD